MIQTRSCVKIEAGAVVIQAGAIADGGQLVICSEYNTEMPDQKAVPSEAYPSSNDG